MKLQRIQGSGTPIYAILSKDYTKLQQVTRKLRRSKYKHYLKIKTLPTKADPSTYFSLFAVPEHHNDFIATYGTAVAKNPRESLARRRKSKVLSSYRYTFENAVSLAGILKLAASKPKARTKSNRDLVPTAQAMSEKLKAGVPARGGVYVRAKDYKRVNKRIRQVQELGIDIC
jgi:hypothetical protein